MADDLNETVALELRTSVGALILLAEDLPVRTEAEANAALDVERQLAAHDDRWRAYHDPAIKQAHALHKALVARRDDVSFLISQARGVLRSRASEWRRSALAAVAAQQVTAQAQADEDFGADAPVITIAPPKLKDAAFRRTWKARLVDFGALVTAAAGGNGAALALLTWKDSAANDLARATRGGITVPGVEFYEEETIAVRKGE